MGNPSPSIRFANAVKNAFAFLVEDYACHISECHIARQDVRDLTFVRYESPTVFIVPSYDNFSGELDLNLGRIKERANAGSDFGINDLIALQIHEKVPSGFTRIDLIARSSEEAAASPYFSYMTHDIVLVPRGVALMAATLKKYGVQALQGDPLVFAALRQARERNAREWGRQLTVSQIREQAEVAWHKRDYGKVASLYSQIRDDLSTAERKRLQYAQSKIRNKHHQWPL